MKRLLEAFKLLKGYNVILKMIVDSNCLKKVKCLINDFYLNIRTIFIGKVKIEKISTDAFCLPSIIESF